MNGLAETARIEAQKVLKEALPGTKWAPIRAQLLAALTTPSNVWPLSLTARVDAVMRRTGLTAKGQAYIDELKTILSHYWFR